MAFVIESFFTSFIFGDWVTYVYHLCSEKPWVVLVMGGRRRGEVEIIRDVLEVCLGGASKTRIVYRANLNFSRLDRYLGLLLGLGFLAAEDDASGGVVYRTTEAGRNFLNGCLRLEGVRGLEKRLVKVQGGV